VDTVRSRLNQGCTKLAESLLATADSAHGDIGVLTTASCQDAVATLIAAERGNFARVLADRLALTHCCSVTSNRSAVATTRMRGIDSRHANQTRRRQAFEHEQSIPTSAWPLFTGQLTRINTRKRDIATMDRTYYRQDKQDRGK
jgi:hypothetical protein